MHFSSHAPRWRGCRAGGRLPEAPGLVNGPASLTGSKAPKRRLGVFPPAAQLLHRPVRRLALSAVAFSGPQASHTSRVDVWAVVPGAAVRHLSASPIATSLPFLLVLPDIDGFSEGLRLVSGERFREAGKSPSSQTCSGPARSQRRQSPRPHLTHARPVRNTRPMPLMCTAWSCSHIVTRVSRHCARRSAPGCPLA